MNLNFVHCAFCTIAVRSKLVGHVDVETENPPPLIWSEILPQPSSSSLSTSSSSSKKGVSTPFFERLDSSSITAGLA